MKCWYDAVILLRKGDIVKITRARPERWEDRDLRLTLFDVLTNGAHYTHPFGGEDLPEPIIGRVIRSTVTPDMSGGGTTYFEIEEGHFEDYVFVQAGKVKKGQAALKDIFQRRMDEYVKIWDPYISIETIKLASNVGGLITILILTDDLKNIDQVKKEAEKLPNRLIIKKVGKLHHDRFILTKGEGWSVGQSLKDFGKKPSQLAKLPSSIEAETAFDETWNLIEETFFEKN